jgi:hypothetical protein
VSCLRPAAGESSGSEVETESEADLVPLEFVKVDAVRACQIERRLEAISDSVFDLGDEVAGLKPAISLPRSLGNPLAEFNVARGLRFGALGIREDTFFRFCGACGRDEESWNKGEEIEKCRSALASHALR